jgi:Asp/Glu/hydantoin racemase
MGQYVGYQALNSQPFFTDAKSADKLNEAIIAAIDSLMSKGADTIVLGGSYFMGKDKVLAGLMTDKKYDGIVIVDPLPLAIRWARMLVESGLSHSKRIYANPTHNTPLVGYGSMTEIPGVLSK